VQKTRPATADRRDAPPDRTGRLAALRRPGIRRAAAAVEVALAVAAILLDLVVPTLVLLVLAALSLAVRRERPATLGLRRPARPGRMWLQVGAAALGWTVLTFALLRPVLEHVIGQREDMSQYAELEGDLSALLGLLALSWTLAAVGEEVAYRGFLLTRLREVLPAGTVGTVVAAVTSAVLFGWAHREYGWVGVAQVTLDALFFTALRFRYRSLWAAVVAHGTVNAVGIVAVFLVGPVGALW
jgi:membrane protease YdiL (CAAX protease family)